jgi:hypothetical protein
MSGAEIMAAAGFILTLIGFAFGVWKYVSSEMKSLRLEAAAKTEAAAALAAMARADLAEYKTHVAETYATKDGMQRQTDQLLRAIESVASRIDGLSERLDSIIMQRPSSRRST